MKIANNLNMLFLCASILDMEFCWDWFVLVLFFSSQRKYTLLLDATVVFGIPFDNQPTEGAFVRYY